MAEAKKKAPTSTKAKAKIDRVMGEFKRGTLKDSAGNKVTDRDQAVAIALSSARRGEKKMADHKKVKGAQAGRVIPPFRPPVSIPRPMPVPVLPPSGKKTRPKGPSPGALGRKARAAGLPKPKPQRGKKKRAAPIQSFKTAQEGTVIFPAQTVVVPRGFGDSTAAMLEKGYDEVYAKKD